MTSETIQTIQAALDPYVKPREQAAYVRRVLALQLDSHLPSASGTGRATTSRPLALVGAATPLEANVVQAVPPGLHRDYLRALAANAAARAQYEEIRQSQGDPSRPARDDTSKSRETRNDAALGRGAPHGSADWEFLRQHAAVIGLREREARLEVLQKHVDTLSGMPASSPTFLDPREVFSGCAPLPSVPREVMESFIASADRGGPGRSGAGDLQELSSRLERVALRAKLRLKKEEDLLREVRARVTRNLPENVRPEAKLAALGAVRSELIDWIETELSKTSEGDEDEGESGTQSGGGGGGSVRRIQEQDRLRAEVAERLTEIKTTYDHYVAMRKEMLTTTDSRPHVPAITDPPGTPPSGSDLPASTSTTAVPSTHLLTPYVAALLAVSREQKDTILHKSHLSGALSRQVRDTYRILDHLADESQLLPRYPGSKAADGASTKQHLGQEGAGSADPELVGRVRPWVTAADAAKLATLEAVAEKIEEGQVSLEASTRALREIDELLGRDPGTAAASESEAEGDPAGEQQIEDIWLSTGGGGKSHIPGRRAAGTGKKEAPPEEKPRGIWASIDGRLGKVNPDQDQARKGQ